MYEIDYSVQGFLDTIYSRSQSEDGRKAYRTGVRKFEDFMKTKFSGSLVEFIRQIQTDKTDPNMILRDFVLYMNNNGYKPRSVSAYVASIKKYMRYCGLKIYNEDFKQMVVMPRKIKIQETPLTKDMLVRLLHISPSKLQATVLVAISSGMRISELVQITLSDIDFASKPTKIRIRAETTKTRTARETFITTEATVALKDYLARHHGWQEGKPNPHLAGKPVFGRSLMKSGKLRADNDGKSAGLLAAKGLLQKCLDRAILNMPDLAAKNENGVRTIHFHAFRKFFRTTVGNVCGRDFAEAIIGHSFYMDTYYQLPEDKKREMYLKAEPYLTISDFKQVEENMTALSEKYTDLQGELVQLKQYLKMNNISVPDDYNINTCSAELLNTKTTG